jgi:hypothetical protein
VFPLSAMGTTGWASNFSNACRILFREKIDYFIEEKKVRLFCTLEFHAVVRGEVSDFLDHERADFF